MQCIEENVLMSGAVIYLIDARRVLRPEEEERTAAVDWSCASLIDDYAVIETQLPQSETSGAGQLSPRLASSEMVSVSRTFSVFSTFAISLLCKALRSNTGLENGEDHN